MGFHPNNLRYWPQAEWAQENQTLIIGFGGTGIPIANEWYGRRDIKDDMGEKVKVEISKI